MGDLLSSTQMADLLTENGTPTRPSTLRYLHKHGLYSAQRTGRDLIYKKSDRPKLTALLKKRRAGRYAALRRGREAALKAAEAQRLSRAQ
jgi:hypothetical protein